jgi:predicted  nucleic acid-binding Zn-ribbon protein
MATGIKCTGCQVELSDSDLSVMEEFEKMELIYCDLCSIQLDDEGLSH